MVRSTRVGGWPLTAAVVGVLALGAATALGGELKRKSSTEPLPTDVQSHFATAKCPPKHKLTGGGAQLADVVTLQGQDISRPLNKREWTAQGFNSGGADSEVTAHVICLKKAKVKLASSADVSGDPPTATAKCPKGTKLSGGGIDIDPDQATGLGSYPSGKREWTAVGNDTPGLTAYAVCLKKRKVTRKEQTEEMTGSAEVETVTVKCKRGTKPTGGGAQVDPEDGFYQGSYPDGKRGWTAEAFGNPGTELTAHVLCLKKKK